MMESQLPMLVLEEPNVLPQIKEYLAQVRTHLVSLHDQNVDSLQVLHAYSDLMDRLLRELFRIAEEKFKKTGQKRKTACALLAQGGYGRRELCLASDVDLLILFEGKPDDFVKSLSETVIQALWDAGLEVGSATRTVKDCRKMMEEDLTIMTSVLEVRHLAGDLGLSEELTAMVQRYFSASKEHRQEFLKKKFLENKERAEKYGGSIFLLEPNLKESEGGLRDYHTLYWIAKVEHGISTPAHLKDHGFLSDNEDAAVQTAVRFLWKVRNELHRRVSKKADQLVVEYQEAMAHALGYENGTFLAVEQFMRDYYKNASVIRKLMEKVSRRLQKQQPGLFKSHTVKEVIDDPHLKIVDHQLTITEASVFEKSPVTLLKIFEVSHRLGIAIDDVACERIEKAAEIAGDVLCEDKEAHQVFRAILSKPAGLGDVLFMMNDLGVLSAYLPEWRNLRFRVQHNLYHVYTVDVHSIFAVSEWSKLVAGIYRETKPTLHQVANDIQKKDLLSFAVLYHDIGKGYGKGHVARGAPLIRQAAERIGFSPEEVQLLEFLELSHLIMTHIAFRRDLEDPNLVVQFAKTMGTMEQLSMLFLLTFCDVTGTSPEAMTSWKSSLLEYLYLRTRSVLEKGSFTTERATQVIPKILSDTLPLLPAADQERCREFFGMMPPRYVLATPPAMIVEHLKLWEKFSHDPIVFEVKTLEREGVNQVTLFTVETASLFSRMAGLFASQNINIVDAQLNLSNKGHALQIFSVTDHEGKAIQDPERWKRVERDLREILQGRLSIDGLVTEKFKPSLFRKKVAQKLPTKIEIDNDVSAYYTVIDIYTHDRVGLLYQVTSTLASLGLYVDVSKISTKIDQVADTFYVKDIFGHKITSETRLKKIQDILQKVMEVEPTPGWRPPV